MPFNSQGQWEDPYGLPALPQPPALDYEEPAPVEYDNTAPVNWPEYAGLRGYDRAPFDEQVRIRKDFRDVVMPTIAPKSWLKTLQESFDTEVPMPVKPERGMLGFAKDTGLDILSGVKSVVELPYNLINAASGGSLEDELGYQKKYGRNIDQILKEQYSGVRKDMEKKLDALPFELQEVISDPLKAAGDAVGIVKFLFKNPTYTFGQGVSSLAMFGPAGVAIRSGANLAVRTALKSAPTGIGKKALDEIAEKAIVEYASSPKVIGALAAYNGALSASGVAENIDQYYAGLDDDEWLKSTDYQDMIRTMTPEDAKKNIRASALRQGAALSGAISAAASPLAAAFEAKLITGRLSGTTLRKAAINAAQEAGEEFAQSGGEQLGENVGIRHVDTSIDLMDNVGKAAVQGAALGGVLGASGGVIAGAIPKSGRNEKGPGSKDLLSSKPSVPDKMQDIDTGETVQTATDRADDELRQKESEIRTAVDENLVQREDALLAAQSKAAETATAAAEQRSIAKDALQQEIEVRQAVDRAASGSTVEEGGMGRAEDAELSARTKKIVDELTNKAEGKPASAPRPEAVISKIRAEVDADFKKTAPSKAKKVEPLVVTEKTGSGAVAPAKIDELRRPVAPAIPKPVKIQPDTSTAKVTIAKPGESGVVPGGFRAQRDAGKAKAANAARAKVVPKVEIVEEPVKPQAPVETEPPKSAALDKQIFETATKRADKLRPRTDKSMSPAEETKAREAFPGIFSGTGNNFNLAVEDAVDTLREAGKAKDVHKAAAAVIHSLTPDEVQEYLDWRGKKTFRQKEQVAPEAGGKNIQVLSDAAKRDLGEDIKYTVADLGDGTARERAARFWQGFFKDKFDADVIFFTADKPAETGLYTGGKIYVNLNGKQRPFNTVAGHEFAHHLETTDPETYKALEQAIFDAKPDLDKYMQDFRGEDEFSASYTDEQLRSEMVADVVGQMLDEPEILKALEKQMEPSVFEKLLTAIKDFVSDLLAGLKNETTIIEGQADIDIADYEKSLRRVRDILVNYEPLEKPTADVSVARSRGAKGTEQELMSAMKEKKAFNPKATSLRDELREVKGRGAAGLAVEQPNSELGASLRQKLVDKETPILNMLREQGETINHPLWKALKLRGGIANAEGKRIAKSHIDPLVKELSAISEEYGYDPGYVHDAVGYWRAAHHAIERNETLQEAGISKDLLFEGTAEQLIETIEESIDKEDLRAANELINSIIDEKDRIDLESGRLTQDMMKARANWDYYVPFKADTATDLSDAMVPMLDETNPMNTLGLNKMEGRTSMIDNPIDSLMLDMNKSINWAAAQPTRKAFLDYAKATKNEAGVRIMDESEVKSANAKSQGGKYTGLDYLTYRQPGTGDEVVMRLEYPGVGAALAPMRPSTNPIFNAMYTLTRGFGRLVTHFVPTFAITNTLRDFQEKAGLMMSLKPDGLPEDTTRGQIVKSAMLNYLNPSLWSASFKHAMGRDSDNEFGHTIREMEKAGGLVVFNDQFKKQQQDFAGEMRAKQGGVKGAGRKFMKLVEIYNSGFEQASSLAFYKAMRDLGVKKDDAAFRARDLMNFDQRGEMIDTLRGFFVFANPAIQSAYNLSKQLRTPEGWIMAASMFAAYNALYAFLKSANGDDDDPEWLDHRPVSEVNRGLVVKVSGDESVRIPVGFGLPMMANMLAVAAQRYESGEMTGKQAAANAIKAVATNFSPINISEADPMDDTAQFIAQMVTPTVLKPAIDIYANKDFAGNKIAPDNEHSDKLKNQQGWLNTEEAYKNAAEEIYKATGYDVQPEILRYLVRSYGGGPGRVLTGQIEEAGLEARGKEDQLKNLPGIGPLFGGDSRYAERKYKEAAEFMRKTHGAVDFAGKNEEDFPVDKTVFEALDKEFKAAEKKITSTSAAITKIRNDKNLDQETKRDRIGALEDESRKVKAQFILNYMKTRGDL